MDIPTTIRPSDFTQTGTRATSLSARLERRFGLGAMPSKRRALYMKLELMVAANPAIEALVMEAAAQAAGAHTDQGRYFCKAVTMKIREATCPGDPLNLP